MDLDDLFRDCYFGDFPINTIEGDGIAATTTQQAPPAPLVPNNTFGAANATPATVPSSNVATVPMPVAPTAASDAVSTAISNAKRKAEEALGPDPTPTPAAVISSSPSPFAALIKSQSASMPAHVTSGGTVAGVVPGGGSAKTLTDQQKVERRERNRKHAKRSRLRKKFLLESLQEQISGLQSEIESLKDVIRKECPDKAEELLEGVSGPKGKFTPLPMPSGFGPVKTLMEPDFRLMSALSGSQQNFAISDPSLPDNPIVYVSQGFLDLTGYTLDQVLGRNCRFLQGPGTDQSAVDIIRKGVREGVDTSVCLLNYKADGTPFWNQFFVAALRDAENNVVNFVGVQCEVSKAVVEKQIKEKKEADAAAAAADGK